MSSENELRIKIPIIDLNTEISNILQTPGGFKNSNLSEFFRLTDALEAINNSTSAPSINHHIVNFVRDCRLTPENKEKYKHLLSVTQGFIDKIQL